MKQEQSRQQSQQSKSQISKSPGNMFMPPRMSQQKVIGAFSCSDFITIELRT